MNYPRLLNSTGKIQRSLYPINVSITLRSTPLSTATITLPKDEYLPARGFVELFTPYGSAGVFRVRSPHDAYGNETTTAELESAIAEVGDYLVKDEISKMMAATTAVQTLFKHYKGTRWKLGSVSALGTGKVAVEAKYTRVLDAILSVLEQKPNCILAFDYTTYPWTLSVVAKGTTVTAEGRLERNVNYAQITYDDTDLCTRAYYQTYTTGSSGTTGKWTYKDANTKSKYGIVEKKLSTSSDLTASEIGTLVDTYLAEHKEPRISIDIDAEELSAVTGESIDKFTIGKLFRLVIPEYKVVVEKNITEVTWQDVYGNPKDVQIKLGKPEDTVITFLHDLDTTGSTSSSGGGGGGGGGGGNNADSKWKEYYTTFERTDDFIKMSAVRQDTTESILEQAGLELNSRGVLVYATDNKKMLGSQLNVHSDQIGMVIGTKNGKNYIKAAEIALSINEAGASVATINADHINISGGKDVQTLAKSMYYDTKTGKLVVTTSGMVARRNRVEYGIFDEGNLTAGVLVTRVNGQTNLKISASRIDIDGIVTQLKALNIEVADLRCSGTFDCDSAITATGSIQSDTGLYGPYLDVGSDGIECTGDISCEGKVTAASLKVGSYNASWKSFSYDSLTYGTYRYWLYGASATATTAKGAVGAYPITGHSSNTIYYLGHS